MTEPFNEKFEGWLRWHAKEYFPHLTPAMGRECLLVLIEKQNKGKT